VNNEKCPHCDADLRGEPIPVESRRHYGDSTHYSRLIGIEIPGVYDGVLYWQCPDCGRRWNRWDPIRNGHRHAQAEFWMAKP